MSAWAVPWIDLAFHVDLAPRQSPTARPCSGSVARCATSPGDAGPGIPVPGVRPIEQHPDVARTKVPQLRANCAFGPRATAAPGQAVQPVGAREGSGHLRRVASSRHVLAFAAARSCAVEPPVGHRDHGQELEQLVVCDFSQTTRVVGNRVAVHSEYALEQAGEPGLLLALRARQ